MIIMPYGRPWPINAVHRPGRLLAPHTLTMRIGPWTRAGRAVPPLGAHRDQIPAMPADVHNRLFWARNLQRQPEIKTGSSKPENT